MLGSPFIRCVLSLGLALAVGGCASSPLGATRKTSPIRDSVAGYEPVTLENGLMIQDLRAGTGDAVGDANPEQPTRIAVRYEGRLNDGRVFDKTDDTPRRFELERLLIGWQEGLVGMRVGGVRKLIIPPELAYRDAGYPVLGIPPNAQLIYVIELLDIADEATTSSTEDGQEKSSADQSLESSTDNRTPRTRRTASSSGHSLGKPHITRLNPASTPATSSPSVLSTDRSAK